MPARVLRLRGVALVIRKNSAGAQSGLELDPEIPPYVTRARHGGRAQRSCHGPHEPEGNNWLVHDGNSGGGMTREHVRSIKGYVIVNPRGSYAENPSSGSSSVN